MRRWGASPVLLASLLASYLVLVLHTPAATAAGFDLRWDACAADGGVANKDFACDTDAGSHRLVGSFLLDQPLADVAFIEVTLDFIVANDQVVPVWWEFFDCRLGMLSGNSTWDPSSVNCDDWSLGTGLGGLAGFSHEGSIAPADTASHRRIIFAAGAPSPYPDLDANQDYFLLNLDISDFYTTQPGGCAGCTVPVCIVLNSISLMNSTSQFTVLEGPQVPGGNFATWQGGSGASCAAVPAKRTTWGAVKSLYR